MDEPRGDNQDEARSSPDWDEVTRGFVDLGSRLRTFFESSHESEASDEVRTAWTEFTGAAQRLSRSVAGAFQDEDVQDGVKQAFGTLIDAVGETVRDAGDPWKRDGTDTSAEDSE